MRHLTPKVLSNSQVSDRYFEMDFEWPHNAPPPSPGSFFTVRVSESEIPLLRRPFAFSGFSRGNSTASMLYERRGTATRQLTTRSPGETIDILAPLGVPFPLPRSETLPVLIAGGIGMGPIFYLAAELHSSGQEAVLIVGARTAGIVPDRTEFQLVETILATDDGSAGCHGTVTDALQNRPDLLDRRLEYFACGPLPMLRAVHQHAKARNECCWVSVEQTMGCAVGACMGCAVRVRGPAEYARVCTEGPVFDSEEIVWT